MLTIVLQKVAVVLAFLGAGFGAWVGYRAGGFFLAILTAITGALSFAFLFGAFLFACLGIQFLIFG